MSYPIPTEALDDRLAFPWSAHVAAMRERYAGTDVVVDERFTCDFAVIDRLFGSQIAEGRGGCWLWTGYLRNGKHGALSSHDTPVYVHRISNALAFGPLPPGVQVNHRCDVGNCINPDHHFRGSQFDNIADMEAKGRARKVCPRGERNPNAHLSDGEVAELRRAASTGAKQRDIAKRFGVSQSTVWRLIHDAVRAYA